MKYPKLFKDQPQITPHLLKDLENRGLIVPEKCLHAGGRRCVEVNNHTAGEVVGYALLSDKLKAKEVTQQDARALMVIEATREKGARESHVSRLIISALAEDKAQVLEGVYKWQKKAK